MYGGEGNDTLAGGYLKDTLNGGGNLDGSQTAGDDFYNDIVMTLPLLGLKVIVLTGIMVHLLVH